jgi:hypothetical protein
MYCDRELCFICSLGLSVVISKCRLRLRAAGARSATPTGMVRGVPRARVRESTDITTLFLLKSFHSISFPDLRHAQITHSPNFDLSVARQLVGSALSAVPVTMKTTRRRSSTACSQAQAASSLDLSSQIIDSVRRMKTPLFVAMDEMAPDGSMTPLECSPGGPPNLLSAWKRILF